MVGLRTVEVGSLGDHVSNVMAALKNKLEEVEVKDGNQVTIIFSLKRMRLDESHLEKLQQSFNGEECVYWFWPCDLVHALVSQPQVEMC